MEDGCSRQREQHIRQPRDDGKHLGRSKQSILTAAWRMRVKERRNAAQEDSEYRRKGVPWFSRFSVCRAPL